MLVGLAAQLAAAAMLCRLMRVAGEVGARLRERRKAHVPSSRRVLRPVAVRPSRMALIPGFESLSRRAPPTAVAYLSDPQGLDPAGLFQEHSCQRASLAAGRFVGVSF